MDKRRTIAFLSPMNGGSYFGAVLAGVRSAAIAAGARVIAIQTLDARRDYAHPEESDFISPVAWDYVDGFVVLINAVSRRYLDAARASGKPIVMISREVAGFDCPVVMPDNRSGAREAVEHLIGHGHRRIGFAGNLAQSDIRERYDAYREVLREHAIEPDSSLFFETEDNTEAGARPIARAVASDLPPMTALFVGCDQNAVAFVSALTDAGYQLPRDVAIVGFDDIEICTETTPALSSVTQNLVGIGGVAAGLVLDLLDGENVANGRRVVPASFIARESCGCSSALTFNALAGGAPTAAGRCARLHDSYRASSREVPEPSAAQAIEAATGVIAGIFEAAAREPVPTPAPGLRRAVEMLHRFSSGRGFIAVTGSVLVLIRELLDGPARDDPAAALRLDRCLLELTLAAHEVRMREKHGINRRLRTSLRDEYDLSRDLMREDAGHAQSLGWLVRTYVRAGCVAFWEAPRDGDHGSRLRTEGAFDPQQQGAVELGASYPIEKFPPAHYLELADNSADDVVFVMPLRTEEENWGFFTLVGPVELDSPTGRETYFQWAALLSSALDHDKILQSLRSQREDLSAAYGRERELVESIRLSEQRYALAAQAANDGLWDWDLATGAIYYAARWKEMLGYGDAEITSAPDEWLGRVHPDDLRGLTEHLRGGAGSFEYEHRLLARDGTYRWMHCRALAVTGGSGIKRLVGSLTDVTARKELEQKLRRGALYDDLTGLPNRVLFIDRLAGAIRHRKRHMQNQFAVLFLDLDGFKDVNDSLGHAAGDALLARVAERLKGQLRGTDTAARIGGDEFAVLLTDLAELDTVATIVGRIHDALALPHDIDGYRIVVTASIGISTSADGSTFPEDMLKHSDLAMYRAKTLKRGTSATYDLSMSSNAAERLQIEHAGGTTGPR